LWDGEKSCRPVSRLWLARMWDRALQIRPGCVCAYTPPVPGAREVRSRPSFRMPGRRPAWCLECWETGAPIKEVSPGRPGDETNFEDIASGGETGGSGTLLGAASRTLNRSLAMELRPLGARRPGESIGNSGSPYRELNGRSGARANAISPPQCGTGSTPRRFIARPAPSFRRETNDSIPGGGHRPERSSARARGSTDGPSGLLTMEFFARVLCLSCEAGS
jgi:hypothetical protein